MHWEKQGRIFVPEGSIPWMHSHAAVPIPLERKDAIRVYFSSRDEQNRSRIGWVDLDKANPRLIRAVGSQPVLELGKPGTFDDNGMMPSSVIRRGEDIWMYYIGWNPGGTVAYRLGIGLAISHDGGTTFERFSDGPLLDRSRVDPYFCTTPCVHHEPGVAGKPEQWTMWYASCTGWEAIEGKLEAQYRIVRAESNNGIDWHPTGEICIDYDPFTQAIACPFVLRENDRYRMWYSFRGITDFRTDPRTSYRLGYAESLEGRTWTRKDAECGLTRSPEGWDSEMMEYASVLPTERGTYLFYNGNGFGRSGFGYARLLGTTAERDRS